MSKPFYEVIDVEGGTFAIRIWDTDGTSLILDEGIATRQEALQRMQELKRRAGIESGWSGSPS
ncbi:hypothetical protein [Bradyrhizobium sp. SZCCHNR1075]|uniref:hypothetical protein n=1 Tax=Bradyrhizobium sp. SZCCHNR1075 TaxID=3057362 RepID=UPI0028F017EF|nr:hypothetical protein [Bradyrhizobium sp. SZCCHNR1075]